MFNPLSEDVTQLSDEQIDITIEDLKKKVNISLKTIDVPLAQIIDMLEALLAERSRRQFDDS